jgi:hypothetical protein
VDELFLGVATAALNKNSGNTPSVVRGYRHPAHRSVDEMRQFQPEPGFHSIACQWPESSDLGEQIEELLATIVFEAGRTLGDCPTLKPTRVPDATTVGVAVFRSVQVTCGDNIIMMTLCARRDFVEIGILLSTSTPHLS